MAMAAQESRLVIVIDAKNAEKTASALNNELQNITTSGNQADKQVGVLGGSIRALAGYMAGVVTVGAAINKMDAYTNLQNRLKLVTTNQQELNKATADTFRIAQNSRQAWDGVVQVYQRFSDNAKTLNIDMAKTAELTETVSKAVAISGASSQAAEAALTQFGQALASGTLRGEELNSILEQTPALAKAIAQGMGITVGQLRAVAAEGKITGDVLVDALTKSKASVDELFSKTDVTIGQSFTLLNNEVQKFVGEAGKGSGAAELLSGSIKTLAENLGLITNAAIVVGVGYLTKAIVTKTMAVQADIAATIAQRAATTAQAIEELKSAKAATTEAQAHLKLTQATSAATQAKFGATAANAKYIQSSDAVSAAKAREAAAEKALQATQVGGAKIGASLLSILGGPVGIGLTVASLAAGYLLMRDNTAKANDKLEEQGAIANKTTEELLKLEGAQRSGAKQDLAEAFKEQNAELERLDTLIGNSIAKISSKNTADAETAKILREVRTGVMDYESAFDALNKTQFASPDVIKKLRDEIDKYEEQRLIVQKNADAQKTLGVQVELSGNKAQNTVGQYNAQANALDGVGSSANSASKALQEYNKSLGERAYDAAYVKTLREKYGYTKELAEETLKLQIAEKGRTSKGVAQKDIDRVGGVIKLESAVKSLDETERKRQSNLSKASSNTQKDAERAQKESNQLAKEMADLRYELAYDFSNREVQLQYDLEKKKDDIRKAFASDPATMDKYIQWAELRNKAESELYKSELAVQLYSFRMSEEEKLNTWRVIETKRIGLIKESFEGEKDARKKALKEQFDYELSLIELNREQQIFQAEQYSMNEYDRIKKQYQLERDEILKTKDEKVRAALLAANAENAARTLREKQDAARNALESQDAGLGGYSAYQKLSADLENQQIVIEKAYELQVITEDEKNAKLLASEKAFLEARKLLNLSYGEQITGSIADMFKQQGDEQSAAYKVMFAASKAFAIAQSLISIKAGIAQAANLPFPLNLAAMASVAASTATLVGDIKAISDVGFKTGGYTGSGGVSDVAGVVHGQEYVLNAAATKRVGVGALDAINSGGSIGGGVNVTIQNYGTSKAFEVQQLDANTVRIIARDEARNAVANDLQNPNSQISKAASQNLNAPRRRG